MASTYRFKVTGAGRVMLVENGSCVGHFSLPTDLFGAALGDSEWDLLHVAQAMLSLDRLARRPRGGKSWNRNLHATIEVCDVERWSAATPTLSTLLDFMTDDRWTFEFVPRGKRAIQQQLRISPAAPPPSEVALFSGGLDSAVGLLRHGLAASGPILAVSSYGTALRLKNQRTVLQALRELGVQTEWAPIRYQLRGSKLKRKRKEVTQRSRGFMFLAVGAVVASSVGVPRLHVYESGIGCINIPFCSAQIGAQATKAMHPRTLQLFNELSGSVLDNKVVVKAPYFFHTKGEVCREVGPALASLASVASSCDEGDGNKANPMEHCGVCTSCLFRRIALKASGLPSDPTEYRDRESKSHGEYEISLFEHLAQEIGTRPKFSDLLDLDPDLRFAAAAPIDDSSDSEDRVAAMFQRYAKEIDNFLADNRPELASPAHPLRSRNRNYDLFAAAR